MARIQSLIVLVLCLHVFALWTPASAAPPAQDLPAQGAALDIGGWRLDGSKGEDYCIMPAGTTLAAGAGYQVATGDSQPQGAGLKCGDKPIWNNGGETIYLRGPSGLMLSIESVKR